MQHPHANPLSHAAALMLAAGLSVTVLAQPAPTAAPAAAPEGAPRAPRPADESGLKSFDEVSKGFDKVVSTADGKGSYYTLYRRDRDGGLLAELPAGFDTQRQFIAMTIATGETFAGLQSGDLYTFWRRLDNRLLLIAPDTDNRSTGDAESKAGVKQIFTDRVILDVPILAMGPSGRPVIDMKELLTTRARDMLSAGGGIGGFLGAGLTQANPRLAALKSAKAFPENVEISYEMPTAGGKLQEIHFSFSRIPDNTGYTPRVADQRIGYFTTVYRDLGKMSSDQKWVRYINRWHLEKADPKLKLSPPKEPIVFYIEHTTPVRYRRYVRDGLLRWNKAFEKVGIADAIQVYYQDAATGAHMDKDPEDVRYNFVRWIANDIGTAIGPSRVHPLTGQILDADIILTDGWIRGFAADYTDELPEISMQGMTSDTIAWLAERPQFDPRVRFADPAKRPGVIERIRQDAATKEQMKADGRLGVTGFGGIAMPTASDLARDTAPAGMSKLEERLNLAARMCTLANGKGLDLAMLRMHMDVIGLQLDGGTGEIENTRGDSVSVLDGIPEWFIGPLLIDLVAHEVGHTLGLRHNFKGSSIYTLAQVNSADVKGKKSFSGSVMDYVPVNINVPDAKRLEEYLKQQKKDDPKDSKKDEGKADEKKADDKKPAPATKADGSLLGPDKPQDLGDYAQVDNGPYDYWAIEFGYTLDDPKKVLERVNEPELAYATDWDLSGPDPLVRQYDFTSNPADYANNLMDLARYHRSRLLDRFVKDGDSWARARRGYGMTLIMQSRAANIMAKQIGGADLSYSKKGDPKGRDPIIPTSGEKQREAVKWIVDNIFQDSAWGVTPEMLTKFTTDRWGDQGGMSELMQDPSFPVHDRIAALQVAALVQIMNPTTIGRVYDNELRVPATTDTLTIPELLDTVTKGIWSEIDKAPGQQFTARQPMISSLRRNLQREHLEFLSFLTNSGVLLGEASKPITNLSLAQLRAIQEKIKGITESKSAASRLDPYTLTHLNEANARIEAIIKKVAIFFP
jgi:hypothetical protein